jgi:hypothetical protein
VIFLQYRIYSLELVRLRREVNAMLNDYVRIFVKCYLQLFLLRHELDLSSAQEIVVSDYEVVTRRIDVCHEIYTFHFSAWLVGDDEICSEEAVLAFYDGKIVHTAKDDPARRSLIEVFELACFLKHLLLLLFPLR